MYAGFDTFRLQRLARAFLGYAALLRAASHAVHADRALREAEHILRRVGAGQN